MKEVIIKDIVIIKANRKEHFSKKYKNVEKEINNNNKLKVNQDN